MAQPCGCGGKKTPNPDAAKIREARLAQRQEAAAKIAAIADGK